MLLNICTDIISEYFLSLTFYIMIYFTKTFESFFSSEEMLMQNLFLQRFEPERCLLIQNFPARLQKKFWKYIPGLGKSGNGNFLLENYFYFFDCQIGKNRQNSREKALLWLFVFIVIYGWKNLQENNATRWISGIW